MKKIMKKITAIMLSMVLMLECIPSLGNVVSASGDDTLKNLVDANATKNASATEFSDDTRTKFDDSITFSGDEPIIIDSLVDLDLDEKTLTSETKSVFKVVDGGCLRLSNGSILSNGVDGDDETDAIIVVEDGGYLALDRINIKECWSALYTEEGSDLICSTTYIQDNEYGAFVDGNIYVNGSLTIENNSSYDLKAGKNVEFYLYNKANIKQKGISSSGATGGTISVSSEAVDDGEMAFALVTSPDSRNNSMLDFFSPSKPLLHAIMLGSNNYIYLVKTFYNISVDINEKPYFSINEAKELVGKNITGVDCKKVNVQVTESDNPGEYYEFIAITIADSGLFDKIESIIIDGVDVLNDKVNTQDINVLKSSANSNASKMAWLISGNVINIARVCSLSDKLDVEFGGLTVGSKVSDVSFNKSTFNGVDETLASKVVYEVVDDGDNVKIISPDATFEANKKYAIFSGLISDINDKFDNTYVFVNGDLIDSKVASIIGTQVKESCYQVSDGVVNFGYVFTTSNPPSSGGGSKKYKANDNDTAEKVSGSGKKGAKRTIVPEEGRRVKNVTVIDKNDKPVEVAMNEDGTYSFIQPASDVIINVEYEAKEIKMEVGTIGATIDGIGVNEYVTPKVKNNETMLPIRFIAENLGAKVEWNELEPNMVYITKGDKKIEIKLGSYVIKVNGEEITLNSAAFAEDNRTYVPFDLIENALDATVKLEDDNSNGIVITEK